MFSNKQSYYHFNPTDINNNILDNFDSKISKQQLNQLFRKQRITFIWKDVELECVNSLRRAIIANIPTYSIQNVDFFERSSQLETNESNEFYLYSRKRPIQNNEQIKLRLELLPIKQDFIKNILNILPKDFINEFDVWIKNERYILINKSVDNIYQTDKEYPHLNYIQNVNEQILKKIIEQNLVIEFDVIHSKYDGQLFLQGFSENIWFDVCSKYFSVYIETFDSKNLNVGLKSFEIPNEIIFIENYLVTRLKRGQYLKFKAYLHFDNGSFNSKHTPVCSVTYMPIPINYLKTIDNEIHNINNIHWSLEQNIPENPTTFLFDIQSLEYEVPENIMLYGINELTNLLNDTKNIFNNMLDFSEKLNPIIEFDRDTISKKDKLEQEQYHFFIHYINEFDIKFVLIKVGYTFCNWFQSRLLILDNIEYCGYQNPHPKLNEMIMYIRFKNILNNRQKINLFIVNIDKMIKDLEKIKSEYHKII
jgi:DNA-directed RNA polymerase subunit L